MEAHHYIALARYGAVFVDAVQVGQRHRKLQPEKVELLAKSMAKHGLQQPISVWSPDIDTIYLVAGLHRLEAAKKLDWEEIDCIYVEMDETERELWEIAENLHRVELTKEERDRHIRRYAELLEERRKKLISQQNAPKLKTPSNPKGAGRPEGVASEVARETGLSKDTVRRALNPQPATDPTKSPPPDDQDRVYQKLCHWWRQADEDTRQRFVDQWM